MNVMKQIEQFIESLFRDETKAQAMIRNPEQTLRDAGLQNATHAQIQTVAATAAPSVAMGGGDPVVGLQRAVANHHGIAQETFAPTFQPQRVIQQETHNDFASHNSIASPTTIVDNSRDLDLNFGDITFGNKTTAVGDGAVAINGDNEGDILSGDGAVKGNNNDVNNGDIKTGDGSAVTLGDDNEVDGESQKVQGDLIQDNKGPVIKDVDTSAGGKDTGTDADGTGVVKTAGAEGADAAGAKPADAQGGTATDNAASGGDFKLDTSTTVHGNQTNADVGGDLDGTLDTHNTHVEDSFNEDNSMHDVDNTTGSHNEMNSHNDGVDVTGFQGGDIMPGM